jgi:hypothetical protein
MKIVSQYVQVQYLLTDKLDVVKLIQCLEKKLLRIIKASSRMLLCTFLDVLTRVEMECASSCDVPILKSIMKKSEIFLERK